MTVGTRTWRAEAGQFLDRHQRLLACVLTFALLIGLHDVYDIAELPFDAAEYWDLARPSVIPVYASPRGYFFPVLLLPLRALADQLLNSVSVIRFGMSLLYAVALPLLLPAAFQQVFGGKVTFVRRMVPAVLLALLFPGVLLYPLTDLPAALLVLGAVYMVARNRRHPSRARSIGAYVAAGALTGAAYYTRSIYIVAIPALLVLVLASSGRDHEGRGVQRWLAVASALLGLLLIGLPQLALNQMTRGVSSLAVFSAVEERSLFASQLVWGITVQRYETTLAPDVEAPTVFYLDPAGERLFKSVMHGGDLFSLPYYLKTMVARPLDFAGLYGRHLVNGLDVRDGIIYTRKPSPTRNRTALFNFAVLTLAFWILWSWRLRDPDALPAGFKRADRQWLPAVAVLLLPVAAIIPGAVESRFFLPLHLLAYATIAFHGDPKGLWVGLRRHWVGVAVATAVLAGAFFAITLSTMAHLQYSWPPLYRYGP
jgi:uncharacterized membrane protein YiaA